MRYGRPAVRDAIDRLRAAACERILAIPLYPQYAASTTASAFDAVTAHLGTLRRVTGLRFIDTFHDDPGYIRALARTINDYWMKHGRPDRLLMSFHGVPRRSLELGDPYHCLCHVTARRLAQELGLDPKQWLLSFQSRFGRARWLQPYTSEVLAGLPKRGIDSVDVICPGFAADCLETLEEIGMENRDVFLAAGGRRYQYIPALNARADHVAALRGVVLREAGEAREHQLPPGAAACFG